MSARVTDALTLDGFWCERLTYRSLTADGIVSIASHRTTNPAQAIRHIRVEVRMFASTLGPRERARAYAWTDSGGCLGALAALHRGEPCGFSLNSPSGWVDWTVRPARFLILCVRHTPGAPT